MSEWLPWGDHEEPVRALRQRAEALADDMPRVNASIARTQGRIHNAPGPGDVPVQRARTHVRSMSRYLAFVRRPSLAWVGMRDALTHLRLQIWLSLLRIFDVRRFLS